MIYNLSNELNEIENEIYLKYINGEQLNGSIKTSLDSCPPNNEFLQIKRNLKNRLSKIITNHYVDDVNFEYGTYSKDNVFIKKHEWDLVAVLYSFGLAIPFLLPRFIKNLYEYYNSNNYSFITYHIKIREKNINKN